MRLAAYTREMRKPQSLCAAIMLTCAGLLSACGPPALRPSDGFIVVRPKPKPSARPTPINTGAHETRSQAAAGTAPQRPLSDEQSFDAVTQRETIESDLARIQANRKLHLKIEPGALPERPKDARVNIVSFAISTFNPVGVPLYGRVGFGYGSYEEDCRAYISSDLAQQAFLEKGGPGRDRLRLDPDGDGFACDWDPEVYRIR